MREEQDSQHRDSERCGLAWQPSGHVKRTDEASCTEGRMGPPCRTATVAMEPVATVRHPGGWQ
jgi:hypothetical protein